MDYIITGVWSQKAYNEAKLLGANPQIVFSTKTSNHNGAIPSNFDSWKFSQDAQYIYYCSNETVQGVEMNDHEDSFFDQFPANVPIVCDMSSNMVSRKFNVSRFGVIIAGNYESVLLNRIAFL